MSKPSSQHGSPGWVARLRRTRLVCAGLMVILMVVVQPLLASSADRAPDNNLFTDEVPDLLLFEEDRPRHERSTLGALPVGRYAVSLNPRMSNPLSLPNAVRFSLPRGTRYEVIQDNQMVHRSGSVTWVGYLKDYGDDYRVLITTGQGRSFGQIFDARWGVSGGKRCIGNMVDRCTGRGFDAWKPNE